MILRINAQRSNSVQASPVSNLFWYHMLLLEQFRLLYQQIKNLSFKADPDYDSYQDLLNGILEDMGEELDFQYDWLETTSSYTEKVF